MLQKDKALHRLRRGLSAATFETFWRLVVSDLCSWIEEGVVQTKRFNEVGAMQFEKDVRHVSILCAQFPTAGSGTDMSLRAEFTRLDQVWGPHYSMVKDKSDSRLYSWSCS